MLKKSGVRRLLEARIHEAGRTLSGRQAEMAGRERFLQDLREQLGLMVRADGADSPLIESVDDYDRPTLAEGRLRPEEISLRELAEGICGSDWVEGLYEGDRPTSRELLESGGPAIDPTSFINVNTYSAAVTGLLEAKILERFQNHRLIGDRLVTVMPSRQNGEKFIGTHGFAADDGKIDRKPGESHARAQFGERWVTTPETREKGLAVEVTKEAVFFDRTGEVLDQAGGVGDILAYGKEHAILDGVIGATNPYNYKGVSYNTYQASAPWSNTHDNAMVDFDNVDKALNLFARMTDPETGREIIIEPTTILATPRRKSLWEMNLMPTFIRAATQTAAFVTQSNGPSSVRTDYDLITSQIFYNRLVAKGVDATKALDYWYFGDPKGAFLWVENWPITVRMASASEYTMLDRGIVVAAFANHRGVFAVKEPRKFVENRKD